MTPDNRPLGTRVAELEARVQALEARLMPKPGTLPPPTCGLCHGIRVVGKVDSATNMAYFAPCPQCAPKAQP